MTPKAAGIAFWTDERIALLKKLWRDGLTGSQIAKRLGYVTRSAVIGKANRLGLASRALPKVTAGGVARPSKTRTASRGGFASVRVSTQGKVFAAPPVMPLPPMPAILDVSQAKPWLERAFGECAFPVAGEGADVMSCCAPVRGEGARYCAGHHKIVYRPTPTIDEGAVLRRAAVRRAA
jgi:GcrA cell cycle regulator